LEIGDLDHPCPVVAGHLFCFELYLYYSGGDGTDRQFYFLLFEQLMEMWDLTGFVECLWRRGGNMGDSSAALGMTLLIEAVPAFLLPNARPTFWNDISFERSVCGAAEEMRGVLGFASLRSE
jgi:hypothetical protein